MNRVLRRCRCQVWHSDSSSQVSFILDLFGVCRSSHLSKSDTSSKLGTKEQSASVSSSQSLQNNQYKAATSPIQHHSPLFGRPRVCKTWPKDASRGCNRPWVVVHYGLLVHSWPPKSLRAGLAGHMDPASEEETPEEGAWRRKEITTAGAGNFG